MAAYDVGQWTNFFLAQAGASAALAGLLFVAISVNLTRIMSFPNLPARAAEGLAGLFLVLFVATVALVPGLTNRSLGEVVLALALLFWVFMLRMQLFRRVPDPEHQEKHTIRVLLGQAATLPFVICGASLVANTGGGLYWSVVGVVFALGQGAFNAWLLTIEILR